MTDHIMFSVNFVMCMESGYKGFHMGYGSIVMVML
jgi:hypothetical protein